MTLACIGTISGALGFLLAGMYGVVYLNGSRAEHAMRKSATSASLWVLCGQTWLTRGPDSA
jgi:hypothetical protein